MRYPVQETEEKHQRILDRAAALLRTNGLSGVSVSEVMKAAGLTHGAFYNHFASKDELLASSVEHASNATARDLLASEQSPQALRDYAQAYLSVEHRDHPGSGCLIASLGAEASREPAVRPAMTRHVRSVVEGFARALGRGKSKPTDDRGAAIRMLSTLVGTLVLARAIDDPRLSDEILQSARDAFCADK